MSSDNFSKEELSYEDNNRLLAAAQKGDKDAMEKLIKLNLPLVSTISRKFMNRGYEYEDIYQIGSIGLVKAINNFNEDFNVKFSTYAVPMIMGEIKRFLRDDGMIKVSRGTKSLAKQLHFQKEELAKKLDREPTIDELAEYSGEKKEDIIFALESSANIQYLYDTVHQEDGAPVLLIDKISQNQDNNADLINRIALKEVLNDLEAKSRQIIMLRYFKDKTQVEVAKMLGISQVQVSRIEKRVLQEIKSKLKE